MSYSDRPTHIPTTAQARAQGIEGQPKLARRLFLVLLVVSVFLIPLVYFNNSTHLAFWPVYLVVAVDCCVGIATGVTTAFNVAERRRVAEQNQVVYKGSGAFTMLIVGHLCYAVCMLAIYAVFRSDGPTFWIELSLVAVLAALAGLLTSLIAASAYVAGMLD